MKGQAHPKLRLVRDGEREPAKRRKRSKRNDRGVYQAAYQMKGSFTLIIVGNDGELLRTITTDRRAMMKHEQRELAAECWEWLDRVDPPLLRQEN